MSSDMHGRRWVLGIRGRLLLAFLGISAFAVLSAAAAVQALLQVSSLVGEITERRTPAIITSLSMSREVERLLAASQELADVESQAVFEQKAHAVALAADDIDRLVARLQEVQGEPVDDLSQLVGRMRLNIVALERKVTDRLAVSQRKAEALAGLLRTDLLFQAAMMAQTRPLVSEAERVGATMASKGAAGPISGEEVARLLELDAAQALQVTFSRAHDLLLIGSSSPNEEDLQLKRVTVRRTIDDLDKAVMDVSLDFVRAVQISARLRTSAESDDGVLGLRAAELSDWRAAKSLQAENATISQELVAKVDGLVQANAQRVQESMEETTLVRRQAMLRLILVTAGTLVCSGLIVWLYVHRNIGARLAAVGEAMLALAGGRLEATLPKPQDDEIGLMASALLVFRETALQAQEREALLNEARERSERAREVADLANRAKSEFLANMSHEIRTPINAIAGFTSLALRTELTPKQTGYLEKVHAATQGLLRVINDLLDFSKIEAGHLEMEQIPFRLAEVIDSALSYVGPMAESKGLELLVSVAPEVPTQLIGDPLRLGQILVNLCSNAVKFTERGEVELRVLVEGEAEDAVRLLFTVRDTGIGMSEEQAAKLFQPFTQADSSTTRRFGGTGLGLVISQRLADMMKGAIRFDTKQGAGTTFFFEVELPVALGILPSTLLLPEALRGQPALVVDDNGAARQILSGELKELGMRPVAVPSGEAALQELRRASLRGVPYPLVLMDWKMPEMDGLSATRVIRGDPAIAGTPVIIMVTAYGREQGFSAVEEVGLLDGVLLKPVTHALLTDTLCRLLGDDPGLERLAAAPRRDRLIGTRLLLVEDNPVNQQLVTEMLEQEGAEVQVAGNGRLALEIVDAVGIDFFDAVLLDLQMPEMDGFETARRIRLLPENERLPLIAITAHAMSEDRERCLAAGMQDHLAKPVDRELLTDKIAHWIGADRLARAAARPRKARAAEAEAPAGGQRASAAGLGELERLLGHFDEALGVVTGGLRSLSQPAPLDSSRLPRWVDAAAALARLGGDARFYGKLMREFVRTQAEAAEALEAALVEEDRARFAERAHLLRGLAANLSAQRIAELAAELETGAREAPPERLREMLAALRTALGELARAVEDAPMPPDAGSAARPRPKDGAPRLLVVDDQKMNLLVIEKMLQSMGLAARSVTSGEDAVRALAEEDFDLVITDLQMPEMSGFELAAAIRRSEQGAPHRAVIIGLSSSDSEKDAENCLASGMDDFVAKPLTADAMRRILSQWLQQQPASAS